MQSSLRAAAGSGTLNTTSAAPHNYQINSLISASSIYISICLGGRKGKSLCLRIQFRAASR